MAHLTDTPQFKNGADVARFLDLFWGSLNYVIRPTTAHEERVLCLGDREFTKSGLRFFIEYKSGIQTFYTGNVFLETVSVDTTNKPGWVYTCQADFIHYAALLNQKILVFRPEKLRGQIEALKCEFRIVKTSKNQNAGYNTHGVIVPLEYAERHLAEQVIIL